MPETPHYAYVIPSMKFGWEHLPTVVEYLKSVTSREDGEVPRELRSFHAFYDACMGLGLEKGWKGTFSAGYEPRIVIIPASPQPRLALAWRAGEEDATIVASEVPMPWLEGATVAA